jgi:hypothetical protein
MKKLACLALALLLCGCIPIGARVQNLPDLVLGSAAP